MPLPPVVQAVLGLVLLLLGGDLLVRGSSRFASALGIPPLVVGLTVVAFGTSAPELAVSVQASLAGNAEVALGNVLGSNAFNVLFILGISALITPLAIQRQLIRLDVPVMVLASVLAFLMALNGRLGRLEAAVLVLMGLAYLAYLAWVGMRKGPVFGGPDGRPMPAKGARHRTIDLLLMLGGLALLVVGADQTVEGAVTLARGLGASELVIGLTLVAAGTSLPEVATSILASIRRERDLAVGNVVGSNIFNLLFVLGGAGVAAPDGVPVPLGALTFDMPLMVGVAVACIPVFITGRAIQRWEGGILLFYYVVYMALLLLDAGAHDARDLLVHVLLVFILPLTLVTALLGWWWEGRDRRREKPA